MKKIRALIIALILAIQPIFLATWANAEATNLIANASVETSTNSLPASWQSNAWGTNTTSFSYANEGHTGSRSLSVSMTARTDGDAKWLHDAATIKGDTEYTYTSWYKASVPTEIDLQYEDTSGALSYAYVKAVPAASVWTQLSATFKTPVTASKVRVMHIVATPGTLQTDDFSLSTQTTAPTPTPTPTPDPVDNDNLILNNSFEAATNGTPNDWSKNAWGTNTNSFVYETTGRTGTRSVTTKVTAFTSGDAKWFSTPVSVVAGKSYQYSDYYKSNVTTRVVVAYVSATGAYTYQELANAPASATTWAKYSATFTVPATAAKVSVYHVIDKVGSLTIDDTALAVAVPPATTSLVLNPSMETANGAAPANWQKSSWGTNTPVFSYETNGHTGSRSAKVAVSNYQNGDAKWYFDPIKLTAGQQYRFSGWYKGSVVPHVVVMFLMQDGTEKYFAMPLPQGSPSTTTWQKYTDTFSVPAGAVGTSVLMTVGQNGWVQTDDFSVDTYSPNGFSRPLLTMTFDDGHEENATTALPLLNKYGFKSTQCFATSFIEGKSQTVINGVLAFKNSGHEICSHTVTHPFLTQVTGSTLTYELSHSKTYLEKLTGQPVRNFATPYGDYNATVVNGIKTYYGSHRSVDEGYNSKDNFNVYNLRVQNILDTTTAAEVEAWINNAKADKTWLIFVYHRVAPNPGPYDTTQALFTSHLEKIKASGVTVKTLQGALDEVKPQL